MSALMTFTWPAGGRAHDTQARSHVSWRKHGGGGARARVTQGARRAGAKEGGGTTRRVLSVKKQGTAEVAPGGRLRQSCERRRSSLAAFHRLASYYWFAEEQLEPTSPAPSVTQAGRAATSHLWPRGIIELCCHTQDKKGITPDWC